MDRFATDKFKEIQETTLVLRRNMDQIQDNAETNISQFITNSLCNDLNLTKDKKPFRQAIVENDDGTMPFEVKGIGRSENGREYLIKVGKGVGYVKCLNGKVERIEIKDNTEEYDIDKTEIKTSDGFDLVHTPLSSGCFKIPVDWEQQSTDDTKPKFPPNLYVCIDYLFCCDNPEVNFTPKPKFKNNSDAGRKLFDKWVDGYKISLSLDSIIPGSLCVAVLAVNFTSIYPSRDVCDVYYPGYQDYVQYVEAKDLADGSIVTKTIKDGSIVVEKIQRGNLTGSKIQDGAITGNKIKPNVITGDKIGDGEITASQISKEILALNSGLMKNEMTYPYPLNVKVDGKTVIVNELTNQLEVFMDDNIVNGITNCIVTIPNANVNSIFDYKRGLDITIVYPIRMLVSDGYAPGTDIDGNILKDKYKNISYLLSKNIDYKLPSFSIRELEQVGYVASVFFDITKEALFTIFPYEYVESLTEPISNDILYWFDIDSNFWKHRIFNNGVSDWEIVHIKRLFDFQYNIQGTGVQVFYPEYPVEILKRSDIDELAAIGLPDSYKQINIEWQDQFKGVRTFRAPEDGWVNVKGFFSVNGWVTLKTSTTQQSFHCLTTDFPVGGSIRVSKGDIVDVEFHGINPARMQENELNFFYTGSSGEWTERTLSYDKFKIQMVVNLYGTSSFEQTFGYETEDGSVVIGSSFNYENPTPPLNPSENSIILKPSELIDPPARKIWSINNVSANSFKVEGYSSGAFYPDQILTIENVFSAYSITLLDIKFNNDTPDAYVKNLPAISGENLKTIRIHDSKCLLDNCKLACSNLKTLEVFVMSNVVELFEGMLDECLNLTTIKFNANSFLKTIPNTLFNNQLPEDFSECFSGDNVLDININLLFDNVDFRNLKDVHQMFENCRLITGNPYDFVNKIKNESSIVVKDSSNPNPPNYDITKVQGCFHTCTAILNAYPQFANDYPDWV